MDGDSLILTCNVWRQTAENGAEGPTRGMRVIVAADGGSGTIKPSDRTNGAERPLYSLVSLSMPRHSQSARL
jgi:single-strand DNA-binding protein